MKHILIFIALVYLSNLSFSQKNFIDQPYIQTSAKYDTLVVPNKIYIAISLNEADNKNKKSVEALEKDMLTVLKKLNINIEKDLFLSDISSNFKYYFLKGQNIIKIKDYTLIVRDAQTVGEVLYSLEQIGIANVKIEKSEYDQEEALELIIKSKAIEKAQQTAVTLAASLHQKIGKAIFIEVERSNNVYLQNRAMAFSASEVQDAETSPKFDFQKIKFSTTVIVNFILE